ncbi:MAG TPA: glycerol phosphate lipoteichoic acid synthase, partial [Bacillota bacterium]|nr:glycerol phosphate lipoteichoic acid synthase [Bacillota bacterium]
EFTAIQDVFYDNETGQEIKPTEKMLKIQDEVLHELELSDKVLQGDLLRYYKPTEDWERVDPKEYFYGN